MAGFLSNALPVTANVLTSAIGWYNALQPPIHLQFSISESLTGGTVIEYQGFEIPEELKGIGGIQKIAIHEYPGGFKSIQTMGAFPVPLEWRGILLGDFNGQSAMQRALTMDLVRRHGNQVTVKYGSQYSWKGIVTKWIAYLEHQNRIRYEIEFEPVEDDSIATSSGTQINADALFQQVYNLLQNYGLAAIGLVEADTSAALNQYSSATDAALIAAAGSFTNIPPLTDNFILVLGEEALVLLLRDENSTNSVTAAAAASIIPYLQNLNNLIASNAPTTQTTRTVHAINPNLAAFAAIYLGDATRWPEIMVLNGFNDIQVVGIVDVKIPGQLGIPSNN